MDTFEYVIPFEACDLSMVNIVGGKCASLGELLRAKIPVPPGFAITTHCYQRFLDENGLTEKVIDRLKGLGHSDVQAIDKASEEIRSLIENGIVSEYLEDVIASKYRELGRRVRTPAAPVAVRSSATAEDLPGASFAGQQETYLWVRGVGDVLNRVRTCWSSLFTPRAISYRIRMGFDHSTVLISVAVQKMVRSFTAGVMFTLNPLTGDPATVVIDSNWGFGESVVSGEVTPDQFQVNKITGEIVKRSISEKTIYYTTDPATDEVRKLEVGSERRQEQSLLDEEIQELAKFGKRIEKYYGKPMDIEWATEKSLPYKGEIFILQSRPETVWTQEKAEPVVARRKDPLDHIVATALKGKKLK